MMGNMMVFIVVSYLTFLYSLVVLVQRQWIQHLKKENNMYHRLLEERLASEETQEAEYDTEEEEEEAGEAEEAEEEEEKGQEGMTEIPPSLPEREVKNTSSFQNLPREMEGEMTSFLDHESKANLVEALANPPPLLNQDEDDEDYSDMPPLIRASSLSESKTEPSQGL